MNEYLKNLANLSDCSTKNFVDVFSATMSNNYGASIIRDFFEPFGTTGPSGQCAIGGQAAADPNYYNLNNEQAKILQELLTKEATNKAECLKYIPGGVSNAAGGDMERNENFKKNCRNFWF